MEGLLRASSPPTPIATSRYLLLPLAALMTGYTVKAMQRKIERGEWVEGKAHGHIGCRGRDYKHSSLPEKLRAPLRGAWFPWMDRQSRTTATTYLNSD